MNALLKKLNFKDHDNIVILNAPEEFTEQMNDFSIYLKVFDSVPSQKINFVLAFVKEQKQINYLAPIINEILEEDPLFWWAYPKGTSKKHTCDFNRDSGWQIIGDLGYEPVRMVSIDNDWTAFRFRKAENIKKMTRSLEWRMSDEGKKM